MDIFYKLKLHFSTSHKLTNSHQKCSSTSWSRYLYYIKRRILETFHIMLSCGWLYLRKICNLSIEVHTSRYSGSAPTKVWFIKTCTHIFTHGTILCQFFKNMYYFEEIRLLEHSKLLRQVKILQKMCPLHSHLKKNFFHIFWIFMWNWCTKFSKKTQDFLTKNDIYFVPRDHNSPNSPQIWPIENFFLVFQSSMCMLEIGLQSPEKA